MWIFTLFFCWWKKCMMKNLHDSFKSLKVFFREVSISISKGCALSATMLLPFPSILNIFLLICISLNAHIFMSFNMEKNRTCIKEQWKSLWMRAAFVLMYTQRHNHGIWRKAEFFMHFFALSHFSLVLSTNGI